MVNNPPGVVYAAKLPDAADFKPAFPSGGNVKGSIAAVANPDGIGVLFKVTFSNLPKEGGPFCEFLHPTPLTSLILLPHHFSFLSFSFLLPHVLRHTQTPLP